MTSMTIPDKTTKVAFKQDVANWMPELGRLCSRGFTPERIVAGVLATAVKNPQIFDCDPKSIYLAMAKCARLVLDPGEGIDLVPMNNKVSRKVDGKWVETHVLQLEAWTGYKGLKALATRQGIIRSMAENCVYEGDRFDFEKGLNEWLVHKPTSAAKRGGLKGAYSIIRLPGGARTFHWMPIEDIEVIRGKSKQWAPTDKGKNLVCPDWYAMKTVVRDYLSRQPQAGALGEALASDDSAQEQEAQEVTEESENGGSEHSQDEQPSDADLDRETLERDRKAGR